MGTSVNLCIQLNINLAKCRLKIPVSVTWRTFYALQCFVASVFDLVDFIFLFSFQSADSFDEIFGNKRLKEEHNNGQQCNRQLLLWTSCIQWYWFEYALKMICWILFCVKFKDDHFNLNTHLSARIFTTKIEQIENFVSIDFQND